MENKLQYESIDLKKLRKDNSEYLPKEPFPHQKKAFKKLSSTFLLPSKEYTGGLLVLPTGQEKPLRQSIGYAETLFQKK